MILALLLLNLNITLPAEYKLLNRWLKIIRCLLSTIEKPPCVVVKQQVLSGTQTAQGIHRKTHMEKLKLETQQF